MAFRHSSGGETYRFDDLKTLLAKAGPLRSGDQLAGVAAESAIERMAARMALADVPLTAFLAEAVIPYETDDVTRLVMDTHDPEAFAPIRHLTVGGLRDWLLSDAFGGEGVAPSAVSAGLTPEMVAAVSKLMRNQDLILVAKKIRVVTRFRTTVGLPGRMSVRLQPNHPTDDVGGIVASTIDGLLYGCGDAVIGINPASDSLANAIRLLKVLDEFRLRYEVPVQSCVLAHVTHLMTAMEMGAPVDLVFQSIAGTQGTNESFGVSLGLLDEAYAAARELKRGTVGENVMYFETGQGSALSAGANHGVDQQTCEVRAYAVARRYAPMLVNTVVGFIGPEYLYDAKQIIRAGLEDHFCGKLMGLPMGCDVCYTNHAEADQDDMDTLLTLLGVAGVNFVMGVPGADDIMLNYQSTSFHDSLYVREVLGLKRAPEFEEWLERVQGSGLRAQGSERQGFGRQGLGIRAQGSERALEALRMVEEGGRLLPRAMPEEQGLGLRAQGSERQGSGVAGRDAWVGLSRLTPARIALGRVGVSTPTGAALEFAMAHARARDAIHAALDVEGLRAELREAGFGVEVVTSRAGSRAEYLLRPDLGRRLGEESLGRLLEVHPTSGDEAARYGAPGLLGRRLTVVVADGLSALAPRRHGVGVLVALRERLVEWELDTVFVATQARVALGDEVGALRGAEAVLVLIGERPGLQASDSLGAYLTYRPRVGASDAERNCVSNIRPGGLGYAEAAEKLVRLLEGARRLGASGVGLKDEGGLMEG